MIVDDSRVGAYLGWWLADYEESQLADHEDAPPFPLFNADREAHDAARERGLLVFEQRQEEAPDGSAVGCSRWWITEAGLALAREHRVQVPRVPLQLDMFAAMEASRA